MASVALNFLFQVGWETWWILKEASFFLLVGFALAGVLAVLIPANLLMRFVGRGRVRSVLWASALGTPLPLCSCGVLPTALGMSRQGATRGATVAFLISTPETGVDSIALSYGLMDPIITVFRPVSAFVTAVVAGIATNLWGAPRPARPAPEPVDGSDPGAGGQEPAPPPHQADLPLSAPGAPDPRSPAATARRIVAYARELLDETAHWLVLGIGLAALVAALLPASVIERYLGGGLTTMLAMLVIGIPIYTCASASTPIAAALVLKGLSPGAALVFLLAGPATNIGAIVVLVKFLGRRVVAIYLASIAVLAVAAGYALDWVYRAWEISPAASFGQAAGFVPEQVKLVSAVLLVGLLAASLWRMPIPHEWIQVRDWVDGLTGLRVTARRLTLALGILAAALYLGSGVYTIGVGEVALETRFGRLVGGPLGPGLHLRWPWPIGAHQVIQRDRVRRIEVGFRSADAAPRGEERGFGKQGLTLVGPGFPVPPAGAVSFWFQKEKVADESFLLTGDENIVDVAFTVQYRVEDPVAYAYRVADPEVVVRSVAIGALRAAIATMTVDALYTTDRRPVEQDVLRAAQEILDGYGIGVRLVAVNLLSVHAPDEVHAAFRDVASAQEDKILITDRATTFAQEAVNLAEGEAAAMVESAQAFRDQKILEAEGDALAFRLREREYRRAPDLTRFRLHLEALEEVLPAPQKILRPGSAELKEFDLWLLDPPGVRRDQ
jgi:HflK protein